MLAADDVLLNTIQFNAGSRHLAIAATFGISVFGVVIGDDPARDGTARVM